MTMLTNEQVDETTGEVLTLEEVEGGEPKGLSFTSVDYKKLMSNVQLLDELEPKVSIKPVYKYFSAEKAGFKCRGLFVGFAKTKNAKGVVLDSVLWMEKDGRVYYNSATILVEDLTKYGIVKGTPIEITFMGKKGDAHNFEVMVLGEKDS